MIPKVAGKSQGGGTRAFVAKRGRPTPEQAAAITAHVLDVARELFLSQGYADTTMDAVAAAAGVSKSTLYSRYPGKGELFHAIVADRLDAWASLVASDFTADFADLGERLTRRALAILQALRVPEVKAFRRMILGEAERFPELAREFHELGYQSVVGEIGADIENAARAAGRTVSDARSVAEAFLSALLGWWQSESYLGDVGMDASDAYAVRLSALFVGGPASW